MPDSRQYSRDYYQRVKADPAKYEALKRRRAENQRKRRSHPVVTVSPETTPETTRTVVVTDLRLQGGKHAPSKTDGGLVVPVEDRIEAWQERRHKDEAREERLAIMEFDGGIDPDVLEDFFLER